MKEYKSFDQILCLGAEPGDSAFITEFTNKVQKVSKNIKNIHLSDDPYFLFSQSQILAEKTKAAKQKLEDLMIKLFKYGKVSNLKRLGSNLNEFGLVRDSVDVWLDKLSIDIDIIKGERRENEDEVIEAELKYMRRDKLMNLHNDRVSLKASKPTLNTSDLFDVDNSYYPFIPKISHKYNKLEPLDSSIEEARQYRLDNPEKFSKINYSDYKQKEFVFSQPYTKEVNSFFDEVSSNLEALNNAYGNYKNSAVIKGVITELVTQGFISKDKQKEIKDLLAKEDVMNKGTVARLYIIAEYAESLGFKPQRFTDGQSYHSSDMLFKKIIGNDEIDLYRDGEDFKILKAGDVKEFKTFLQVVTCKEQPFKANLADTPYLFVATEEDFHIFLKEIENYSEIAIDLEAHQHESYLGLTCLMQLSTRDKDYIVDCILLRQHMYLLNKVFTNPQIVKVLHGCDYDVLWLQRDFGLYLVNVFDTGIAANTMRYPSKSLASLLLSICGVTANKEYQLSDWRIRPLTKEMLKYAREDTHYLLFIYDHLRFQLLKFGLSSNHELFDDYYQCFKRSNEISLKNYTKPSPKSAQYYRLIERGGYLNRSQLMIYKVVLKFRDYVGRVTDFSTNAVMSNDLCREISKLKYSDINEEKLSIILKKSMVSNKLYAYLSELCSIMQAKYNKINNQIDSQGTYEPKVPAQLLISPTIIKGPIKVVAPLSNAIEANHDGSKSSKEYNSKLFSAPSFIPELTIKQKINSKFAGQTQMDGKSEAFSDSQVGKLKNIDIMNINKFRSDIKATDIKIGTEEIFGKILGDFKNFNLINYIKEKNSKIKVEVKKSKQSHLSSQQVDQKENKPDPHGQSEDSSLLNIKRQRANEVKDIDKPGKRDREVVSEDDDSQDEIPGKTEPTQNKKIRDTIQYVNSMFDSKRDPSKPIITNKHGKR